MKNKTKRKVLSLVLSFFLTVSMLAIVGFAEMKAGILNKENLRTSLVKSSYINNVQNKVETDLKTLLEERGLDTELSNNVLTYDAVYMDISNYIDTVFAGKEATISTAEFEQNLKNEITNSLEAQGVVMTEYLTQGINEVVTVATSSYSQYVTPKAIVTLHSFINNISGSMFLVGVVGIVLTIIISAILLSLYRYKHHAMSYIIYSAIATVIVNGVGTLLVAKTNLLEGLGIGPQYYLDFINEFIKGSINECYIVTAICAAIVVLLFLVTRILRNISRK